MSERQMIRVSKDNTCPICQKPDWCLVAKDRSAAICARIEEGSVKKSGDAGWLHILIDSHNRHNRHKGTAKERRLMKTTAILKGKCIDFERMTQQYSQQLNMNRLKAVSKQLGVSIESLKRLYIGWDSKAYTFPMSNDFGKKSGIHRRFPNGFKASVKGSKVGLFIPSDLTGKGPMLICEGLSDTVAALCLAFDAIGRPSCNSKVNMTARYVQGRNIAIVADNDTPGRSGTEKLALKLVLFCPSVKIICPPAGIKDLRQWLSTGLTSNTLQDIINKVAVINTKVCLKS